MKTCNTSKAQASPRTQEEWSVRSILRRTLSVRLRMTQQADSQLNLGTGEKSGEKRRPLRHCVDEDVFVNGMSAVANGTEAVECGKAERGGEVAIRAAPSSGFAQ